MNNDLISVIVPAHNCEKTIRRCIESIEDQTYSNIEIVIIENKSTDKTVNEILKIEKEYNNIKFIQIEIPNVSAARNKGMECSNGKYITFCDSDDYVSKKWIETLYEMIKKNDNCLPCVGFTRNDNLEMKTTKIMLDNPILEVNICDSVGGYVWNKLFRKDIVAQNNIKFDEEIYILEDLLFVSEYSKFIDFILFNDSKLYKYEINQNSATNKINLMKRYSMIDALKKIMCIVNDENKITIYNQLMRIICTNYKIILFSKENKKKYYLKKIIKEYEDLYGLYPFDNSWKIKEKIYKFLVNITKRVIK